MYDINLLPIRINQASEDSPRSILKASAPPRRAVRSRSEDLLIMSLRIYGDDRASSDIQQTWLDNLIHSFFRTSGSVTSAMRVLIETLNLTLMEKNLKSGRDVGPTTAEINLAAIHRRILYVVQCGSTHAYVLNQQGLDHFYDTSQTDRGLGFSRSPNIRYYQAEIGQGSYFFTTTAPPETWKEDTLFAGGFPNLDQLRRRLLNQVSQHFYLDLIQIIPGEGDVVIHQQQKQVEPVKEKTEIESDVELKGDHPLSRDMVEDQGAFDTREIRAAAEEEEDTKTDVLREAMAEEEIESSRREILPQSEPEAESAPLPEVKRSVRTHYERPMPVEKPEPAPTTEESIKEETREKLIADPEEIKARSLKGLASFLSGWRSFRGKIRSFFQDLIGRWAPSDLDGTPRLSRRTLLIIAVVVPLILVGIAAGVYLSRGRTLQYQRYLEQAQLASTAAMAANDPNQSREVWFQVMDYLDQAESYKETDEIVELRDQAQDALDALDGAVRLTYQPAIIGSLYSEINITEIISYGPDLYLLDAAGGRVIHAERMSQGYEIDPDFVCAEGNYSGGRIEAIVDMVSLPLNNPYQAHILAVDAIGNAAYCGPDQNPTVQTLPTMSGINGPISSIAYDVNYLYALVPTNRAILVYRPTNGQFLDSPSNFFEDMDLADIPDLSNVMDIAVNGPDLYLLRGDGKLVDCTTSGLAANPVTCETPVSYIDGRPGKEDQVFNIPASNYSDILYTTPPDPSLSILDANNGDIYRFSLRFRLYERLRPEMDDFEVESPVATAFTIGIDRVAFLAFGHQVFYAYVE